MDASNGADDRCETRIEFVLLIKTGLLVLVCAIGRRMICPAFGKKRHILHGSFLI